MPLSALFVVLALLWLVLPFLTFLHVRRLRRDVTALRDRVRHLEGRHADPQVATQPKSSPAIPLPAVAAPDDSRVAPSTRETTLSEPAPAIEGDPERIERQIGERLLLYAGMVVLILGVAFFLRYAFEQQWLSPTVRVVLGTLSGVALIAGGRRLARAGYRQYGLFLCGGGLALLFLSVYAAFALYALLGRIPTFALLAVVAAGAAVLADREASLPLAFMAVCGGFATPFLVGGGTDAQFTLFSYDALLIAATIFLAHRRGWPLLNVASFLLTILTVGTWAATFYTAARYLRTELWLTLYCAMFVAILRETLRSTHPGGREAALVLWCAPVIYHLASLAILNDHARAFQIYAIVAALAVVVAASERASSALRLTGWALATVPLVLWIADHQARGLVMSSIAAATGSWLLFLAAQVRLVRRGDALDPPDTVLLHANGLGAFVAGYETLVPFARDWQLALVAVVCAAVNVGVWSASRRDGSPAAWHWLAVGATLAAIAIAVAFAGHWVVVMWAAEGAAVVWTGVRQERRWLRVSGLALFAMAVLRWLQPDILATGSSWTLLLNARALSGLTIVGFFYYVGSLLTRVRRAEGATLERALVLLSANALTVVLISLEIVSFWRETSVPGADPPVARSMMLSAWWVGYAGILVAIGMRRHYAAIRYFAILLFAVTIAKVFAVDLQQLEGLYRVAGFVIVGGILLLVSFLYQRSRGAASDEPQTSNSR